MPNTNSPTRLTILLLAIRAHDANADADNCVCDDTCIHPFFNMAFATYWNETFTLPYAEQAGVCNDGSVPCTSGPCTYMPSPMWPFCKPGTDCSDCGPSCAPPSPPPPSPPPLVPPATSDDDNCVCDDTCIHPFFNMAFATYWNETFTLPYAEQAGVCNDGSVPCTSGPCTYMPSPMWPFCKPGTDCSDCGPSCAPPSSPPPSPPPFVPPATSSASVTGDPHMQLAYGGRADLRGLPNAWYNLLSTSHIVLNVLTVPATFVLNKLIVHGSYMTKARIVQRLADGGLLNVSFDAATLNDHMQASRGALVTATCGDGRLVLERNKGAVTCSGAKVNLNGSTLTLVGSEWFISITGSPVYNRLSGPHHRVDVKLQPLLAEELLASKPHGLVGQSFDGSHVPRFGRLDQYPPLGVPSEFTTYANAEGAIEGTISDYQLSSEHDTEYKFSRFRAA